MPGSSANSSFPAGKQRKPVESTEVSVERKTLGKKEQRRMGAGGGEQSEGGRELRAHRGNTERATRFTIKAGQSTKVRINDVQPDRAYIRRDSAWKRERVCGARGKFTVARNDNEGARDGRVRARPRIVIIYSPSFPIYHCCGLFQFCHLSTPYGQMVPSPLTRLAPDLAAR